MNITEGSLLPAGDYVSPGFEVVHLDRCFPNLTLGNPDDCPWIYLRREIPHNWYVDRRFPYVGFLSRDEAHILYNNALQFQGKKALEIGCWMGWSACHLAKSGVELDVIDPLLAQPLQSESVTHSLQAAGVLDSVRLHPGFSPGKVEQLAREQNSPWSLIFIDGDHEGMAPLQDAIACEPFAAADAAILFHDLASPDVARGLEYLRQRGWQTMVYQTMQIMGIAWRGNVYPVQHQPDPSVAWSLPDHLCQHPVSGMASPAPIENDSIRDTQAWITQVRRQVVQFQAQFLHTTPRQRWEGEQASALNQQGRAAWVKGDLDQALSAFSQAVKINPASAIAHHALSQLYWQQRNFRPSLHHQLAAQRSTDFFTHEPAEFQALLDAVRPYTMLSEAQLFSLYSLAKQVCLDDLPGHFVECGTCQGGAAALVAAVIQRYSLRPRRLYAFDTFAGMPEPSELDRHQGVPANLTGLGAGTLKAPLAQGLEVVCQLLGVQEIVVPVPGLFAHTLPKVRSEIGEIALLHANGNWYESTMDIFNHLFDQVVRQGAIQIDDYGFWEGCQRAIHEFERDRDLSFPLRVIDETGVWFRKDIAIADARNHWQPVWYMAQAAEQNGDTALAEDAARLVLEMLPGFVQAQNLLDRLQAPLLLSNLQQELRLNMINLILFPDWQQPEELLLPEIAGILQAVLQHPDKQQMTLLIDSYSISEEEANLVISGVILQLLYDDLAITTAPEISLIRPLSPLEWRTLQPLLCGRIQMTYENRAAVIATGLVNLPTTTLAALATEDDD